MVLEIIAVFVTYTFAKRGVISYVQLIREFLNLNETVVAS